MFAPSDEFRGHLFLLKARWSYPFTYARTVWAQASPRPHRQLLARTSPPRPSATSCCSR